MALGPGKYDDLCTYVRKHSDGIGAVVIILGGSEGEGFSIQAPIEIMHSLTRTLRFMADTIDQDLGQLNITETQHDGPKSNDDNSRNGNDSTGIGGNDIGKSINPNPDPVGGN